MTSEVLIINLEADETKDFFATVQNILLFAITGQTAAEITSRSDKNKLNMGIRSSWKNPTGRCGNFKTI